jgi:hypothetical protein
MQPLSKFTGKRGSVKLKWSDQMFEAFETLKKLVAEECLLAYTDYSPDAEKLELWVDASATGAGACLVQKWRGVSRAIVYASTTFLKNHKNYSTTERELAALRWAVKNLRPFLYGIDFIVHTDHQALVYLHNMKLVSSMLARTVEHLAEISFQIQFTPGRLNVAADRLSRWTSAPEVETERENDQPLPP